MNSFYLHNGKEQAGPFSKEELKARNISKETMVWAEGMTDWKKAGEVEELKDIFSSVPPPFKSTVEPPVYKTAVTEAPPKRKSRAGLLILLLLVLGGAAFGIWKYNEDNDSPSPEYPTSMDDTETRPTERKEKTKEELAEELGNKEEAEPGSHIRVSGTFRKNLIGEMVLEGVIRNNATVAVFKDVVIRAEFLAASGTVLDTKTFTRYEILGPGHQVDYKFKTQAPKETESVNIGFKGATVVE